jgi:hypothetical protein
MMFMGGYYDRLMIKQLPEGASLDTYRSAAAGTELSQAFDNARSAAGPEVLNTTMIIPIILTVAFAGLVYYMRKRKKANRLEVLAA